MEGAWSEIKSFLFGDLLIYTYDLNESDSALME